MYVTPLQVLSEVEDSLREFEQRVSELKTRAEGLQSEQISSQELLKLQVTSHPHVTVGCDLLPPTL